MPPPTSVAEDNTSLRAGSINSLSSQIWKESSSASSTSVEALARTLYSAGAESHATRILEEHYKSAQRRKDSVDRLKREQEQRCVCACACVLASYSLNVALFFLLSKRKTRLHPSREHVDSPSDCFVSLVVCRCGCL